MIPGTLAYKYMSIKLKYIFHRPLSEVDVVDVNISQEYRVINKVIDSLQWRVHTILCFVTLQVIPRPQNMVSVTTSISWCGEWRYLLRKFIWG